MSYRICLLVCVLATGLFGQAPAPGADNASNCTVDTCQLSAVIAQVKAALDLYQNNLGSGPDALPPLSSAEFDFKTTTAESIGGTINLFIFKFGASHEKDAVTDVTFTYSVPPPPKPAALASKKAPPTLPEVLASTIQSAAKAVGTSGTLGKLKFSQLVVNLQFGVKWDVSGGISAPISFVTVGINADKNKNTVQSVKLTFSNPKPGS
jgi:hypothetical protein